MKFVTVSEAYFQLCGSDKEILHKGEKRPHVLVVDLKYKEELHRFAIPLRSNIPQSVPKKHYFPLPPRSTTRPGCRHGLHYTKMFPILKEHQQKFWVGKDASYILYQTIITKNEKRIVKESQAYLDEYAQHGKPMYAVDIDAALEKIK